MLAACVPTGSAPPFDAGVSATASATPFHPSSNVMTAVFEDNFDRPDSGPEVAADAGGLLEKPDAAPPSHEAGAAEGGSSEGGLLAQELKDAAAPVAASSLGPNWTQIKTNAWRIENGKLCGTGSHNHGVWMNKVLPINARIEFDAMSTSDDGDLKAEVWGDGQSAATGVSYNNATSYLAILGGWKNPLHVLARLNEHGQDRKEIKVDKESDDPRQKPVVKFQVYRFKIERTDGKTVHFSVDGVEYHSFVDPQPLAGAGHDHFGFNEWEVKTCYDNVKVTPL